MARCGRCGSALDDQAPTCPLCGGTIIPAQVERGLQPLYRPGDVVAGRFRIEKILGSGASGIVYGVHDANTDGRTALKVLWDQVLSDEPALLRLRREIQAAQCAPNPYCVAVHDLLYIEGRPAILMEWVEGETLRDKIRRQGALPCEEAAVVAGQVLQAMGHLHALGVIHRDIKSGNVLIAKDGTAKLGDFGLAKGEILGETLTQTGITLGTPGYMAPEVIRGRPATAASDLYSLGAMLFEMLTGRMPYQGNSALEVASRQISESPPLDLLKEKRVPRWLAKVAARLLERDPADRFPSAHCAVQAIEDRKRIFWINRRQRRAVLALSLIAILLSVLTASALWWDRGAVPLVSFEGNVLSAKNTFGQVLLKRTFHMPIQSACSGHFGTDGSPAIACALAWNGALPAAVSDNGEKLGNEIYVLDETGATIFATRLRFGNQPFAANYQVELSSHRFRKGEPERLLAIAHHVLWYPAALFVYSPLLSGTSRRQEGDRFDSFYSSGHIAKPLLFRDLDGDGTDEVVFSAINNRLYKAFVAGAMDVRTSNASISRSYTTPDVSLDSRIVPPLYRLISFTRRNPTLTWTSTPPGLHLLYNNGFAFAMEPNGDRRNATSATLSELNHLNTWITEICRLRQLGDWGAMEARLREDPLSLPPPYGWLKRLFTAHALMGLGHYEAAITNLKAPPDRGEETRPYYAFQMRIEALFLQGRFKECVQEYIKEPIETRREWSDAGIPAFWASVYSEDEGQEKHLLSGNGIVAYPMPETPALLAALQGDYRSAEVLARAATPETSSFPAPALVLVHILVMQHRISEARALLDMVHLRFAGEGLDDGETEVWLMWHEHRGDPALVASMDRLVEEKRRRAMTEVEVRALLPLTLARSAAMHRDSGDLAAARRLQAEAYHLAPKSWKRGLAL